ncbi:MAG: hypothetical protein BGO48_17385 [Mucilaginibacter sp. 44-25]|nr:MAG: hypothetical protein BGO48_17385 [Mucilaginibacter sp. 44-25]
MKPLVYKTLTGHKIKITDKGIFYDDVLIGKVDYPQDILTDKKQNRIVEDEGAIFLFLAFNGKPNSDRLVAFSISPKKATLVADAILSPIKDYDNDGNLEFGGRDLTEAYTTPDSMYYIPTKYYEIVNGTIKPDLPLTRKADIKINGIYLPPNKQLNRDGNCCRVISTPEKTKKHN